MKTDAAHSDRFFRLFVTNGGGRIDSVAREIRASSDEDAIARAIEAVGAAAFELWDGPRCISVEGRGERDANRLGE